MTCPGDRQESTYIESAAQRAYNRNFVDPRVVDCPDCGQCVYVEARGRDGDAPLPAHTNTKTGNICERTDDA